jgi:hypothetical protein
MKPDLTELRLMRAAAKRARQAIGPRTHCKRGHPLEGDNVVVSPAGNRQCRACKKVSDERSHKRRAAERRAKSTHLTVRDNPHEFFQSRIEPDLNSGCWLWSGTMSTAGYGIVRPFGQRGPNVGAHRFSLQLAGHLFRKGDCALHKCDTPACVNPAHLYVGSVRDNARDAVLRGRHWTPFGKPGAPKPRPKWGRNHPNWGNRKSHCAKGHELVGENLRIIATSGKRRCRACEREASARYSSRQAKGMRS